MRTNQQQETLRYFNRHAEGWQRKARSTDQGSVNVIQQRNDFVLSVIRDRFITRSALDIGCGTGELVCAIAGMGIAATGVDFADEMIAIARAMAERATLRNADFCCSSVFDFDLASRQYDVVSANGFIEYISLDELDRFLALATQALTPGGSLVVGSRNRLFNIFSLNAFTAEEVALGTVMPLLREALALASGATLEEIAQSETVPLETTARRHAHTGVAVAIRHQFTPAQLMKMLDTRGFLVRKLSPVHIHGAPPAFKARHPDIHTHMSTLLQNFAGEEICLIPYASSFMIHAERRT